MRIVVNLPKPFPALEQALAQEGCEIFAGCRDLATLRKVAPDACLMDLPDAARNLIATWRLKAVLARTSAPLVLLDRDAPWYKGVRARRLWFLTQLGLADLHATHSMQHAGRFGPGSFYLPNAAWLDAYNLHGHSLAAMRNPAGYVRDVAFLGNTNDRRYPEHRARMEFLRELARQLAGEGIGVEMIDSSGMAVADQVRVIQESRINLNIGAAADNGGEPSWGLPERCYGIPACGGFLFSDRRRHAAADFVPGLEWADFASLDECIAGIRQALANFGACRNIAEAAHRRVIAEHTYAHRARTLMAAIDTWRQRRLN
jgi:spore maturation protein CgeB